MKMLMTLLLGLMTFATIAQQFDNNGFEQDPSCPDNCLFVNTQMACVPAWDGFPADGGINFLQKNICSGDVVCVGERSILLRRTGSIINGIKTGNPIPTPDTEGIPEVVSLNALAFSDSSPGTGVCISGLDTPGGFPTELGCAAPTQLGQCENIFVILDSDANEFNELAFTTRPLNGGNPGATHRTVVDEISYDGALFEIENDCNEITFQFNTGGIGSIVEAYLVDIIDPDGNTLCTFEESAFETLKTCAIDEAGTYEVTVALLFNNGADAVVFDVDYEVFSAGANCCQAPVPHYFFEDADGNPREDGIFCFGEEVFMNGLASTDEDSYFVSIWQYNIGGLAAGEDNLEYCRIFPGQPDLLFEPGEVPVRSLSEIWADCFGSPDFEPGFEYRLQLVVTNECFGGWHAKEDEVFTVICCDENELDPSFRLTNGIFGDDSYTIEAIDYELYVDQNAIHEWFVYTEDPDGSTNPVATFEGPTFSYDLTEYGIEYFVIHSVRTECEERCFRTCISNGGNGNTDEPGETGHRRSRSGSIMSCIGEEVDCELINDIFSSCDDLSAPTNLHIVDGTLVWGPVLGASSYSVSGTIGGFTSCNCGSTTPTDFLIDETTTNSLPIPDFLLNQCFEWTVTVICSDGNSAISEPACYPSMFQGEGPDQNRAARKNQPDRNISINPNPAKNHFELFNNTSKEVTIELYQINGQLLLHREVQAFGTLSVDAATIDAGLYLVQIKDKQNGTLIHTEKLIIQK